MMSRRGVWISRGRSVALLAALTVGVVVAWWAHHTYVAPRARRSAQRVRARVLDVSPRRQAPAPTSPGPLPDPWDASGPLPMTADPAGVAPPAGARRVAALETRDERWIQQWARYEYDGDADAAESYYNQQLAELGLERWATRRADGRVLVIYAVGAAKVELALRIPAPDSTIGHISLRVIVPAGRDD